MFTTMQVARYTISCSLIPNLTREQVATCYACNLVKPFQRRFLLACQHVPVRPPTIGTPSELRAGPGIIESHRGIEDLGQVGPHPAPDGRSETGVFEPLVSLYEIA